MDHDPSEITRLLHDYRDGKKEAVEELLPLVYRELRKLANSFMQRERAGHTLQPTALVHEAYLRMFGSAAADVENRSHFFAIAARQMRRVLVDHARSVHAEKRGGQFAIVPIDNAGQLGYERDEDVVALDQALDRLAAIDERAAKVVELRYFGGLTEAEACNVLGIGLSTMKRDWEFARSWLMAQMHSSKQA